MTKNNFEQNALISLVEDDPDLASVIYEFLSNHGFHVSVHTTGENFIESIEHDGVFDAGQNEKLQKGIILLDIRLPGISGIDVFEKLLGSYSKIHWPVCFITGHGDVNIAVNTIKMGAIDFLLKPFSTEQLLSIINNGLTASDQLIGQINFQQNYKICFDKLTDKEKEVMLLIANGNTNKSISKILNNSIRTIELHRSRVFEKMNVESAIELARIYEKYSNISQI